MDGEWLSYLDAGRRLGISTAAARQLSRRRNWQRRTPNAFGARAEILVPAEALEKPVKANPDPIRTGHTNGLQTAYEMAVAALAAQLDRANHRGDVLEAQLADTKSALAIVTDRATARQAEHDRRNGWGLARRLKWALRRR